MRRLLFAALFLSVAMTQTSAEPKLHAVLIGINDYLINDLDEAERDGPLFPDLNGALNDLDLISDVLVEEFSFDPASIVTLRDREATRTAILDALNQLADRVKSGDVVYVHFSGHGSQVPDRNGEESDGSDETILPYDARTADVRDITDDELGAVFAKLSGARVTVVLDSCHSGTATRSAALITRAVPPDHREWLYENATQPKTRAAVETDFEYVLMTGAAEQQAALDGPIGGRYYGFFSYMLGQALRRLPPESSARDVHEEILAEYRRFGRRFRNVRLPEPQLEGPAARLTQPVFPDEAPSTTQNARKPFALVTSVTPKTVEIDASGFDAAIESLWLIYPPGELSFEPGAASALVEVRAVAPRVEATVLRSSVPAIPVGARAIPTIDSEKDGVLVGLGDMRSAVRERIANGLSGMPRVRIANEGELVDFLLVEKGRRFEVRGLGGLSLISAISARRDDVVVRHALRAVKHGRSVAKLRRLENRNSGLDLSFDLVGRSGEDLPRYTIRGEEEPRSGRNSLQVEFSAPTDGYLTIVDVDTEGSISVLFPNPISQANGFLADGFVAAQKKVRIPDEIRNDNRAGFVWDIVPPSGIDTLQAFFTVDLETAREIRRFMSDMASDEEVSTRSLARTLASRGVKITAVSADEPQQTERSADWASRTVSFLVEGDE